MGGTDDDVATWIKSGLNFNQLKAEHGVSRDRAIRIAALHGLEIAGRGKSASQSVTRSVSQSLEIGEASSAPPSRADNTPSPLESVSQSVSQSGLAECRECHVLCHVEDLTIAGLCSNCATGNGGSQPDGLDNSWHRDTSSFCASAAPQQPPPTAAAVPIEVPIALSAAETALIPLVDYKTFKAPQKAALNNALNLVKIALKVIGK